MSPLDALKLAYRKHVMDDPRIGWDELEEALLNALCNEIGDKEFVKWVKQVREEIQ